MAPDIVFSPLPNTRSRHTSDGRGEGAGGSARGGVLWSLHETNEL